jgi:CheY-like chemotaxis protein
LKLLWVEPDPEDACLLAEAMEELESTGRWAHWMPISAVRLEALEDALACLSDARYDAILLNPELSEGPPPFQAFLQIRATAPNTPILILVNAEDDSLAASFLRHGAQDVLLKPEIEGLPLARAIHNSIERQRNVVSCPNCAAKAAMLAD